MARALRAARQLPKFAPGKLVNVAREKHGFHRALEIKHPELCMTSPDLPWPGKAGG
jgi:hypothetical protein